MHDDEIIYYTVPEIAKRLKVSSTLIYRLIDFGHLDCHRIGQSERGVIRITQEQLDMYLEISVQLSWEHRRLHHL